MSSSQRALFLIDADNVSIPVIEAALAQKLAEHGAMHVRRCYCSADFAVKNLAFLKEHSIRPMVNATAGKNCTDIALAIDAVQLCSQECPRVVVIVASDSDFAPLVLHLRELGARVEGVGQEGKTGAESHRAYDDFVDVPVGRKRATAKTAARAAPPEAVAAQRPPPATARQAARQPPSARLPPPPTRLPPTPARQAPTARAAPVPDDVAGWLASVPGLRSGEKVELRTAAEALRKDGLLARNASSTRLFKKYPALFELLPAGQPNSVQYRAAMSR